MKIVSVNGSPKGKASNTHIMVNAFLNGAADAGAETTNIFLSEKEIKYCRGCHSCWFKTPGQCVIHDDMTEVLSLLSGAHVIILASPLYFNNISGTLKVFMDRLTFTGSPVQQKNTNPEKQIDKPVEKIIPKLIMISNCGYADRSQFQVVSLWIKRVASLMQTVLLGEIYAVQGKRLSSPSEEIHPAVDNYLKLLQNAGKEIVLNLKWSESTENLLNCDFV